MHTTLGNSIKNKHFKTYALSLKTSEIYKFMKTFMIFSKTNEVKR